MKYSIVALMLILAVSCKKTDHQGTFVNTGNPNNKLDADIKAGNSVFHLSAWGDYTLFNRALQGTDSVITILGGTDTSHIQIDIFNINTAGIYQFGTQPGTDKFIRISYSSGTGLGGPYYMNKNSLNGKIIIESITSSGIKGSFMDTCWNGTDTRIINNGSFNGAF
ncbi:MAG: hypothetical protein ABI741_06305 [Ferruginibacter sp.]